VKEFALRSVALYRLRCGDDGHPFLDILYCGIALLAEKIQILLRRVDIPVEPEEEIGACGVGGGVGTAAQGRDAAPKAAPENFDQFITGRNVVKNKAVVDRASCYYWDGNN